MANKVDWSKLSPASIAGSIVAVVVGVALGRYANFNLIFPVMFTVIVWFALRNMAPTAKQPAIPVIAWQGGQLLWFVLGAALSLSMAPGQAMQILPDVVILGGLLVWFYVTQGRVAAWVLIAYQALSLLINAWLFTRNAVESPQDRALAVHIVWRVVALVLLAMFIRRPAAVDPVRTAETFT